MGQQVLALLAASLLVLGGEASDMEVLPIPTPQGYAAEAGFSPRPTDPPGSVPGIPHELLQRQDRDDPLPYPAPGWYCGLVDGQADWPLSCIDARAHCIFAGTAVGCCLGRSTSECRTQIPTSCVNSAERCPECETDTRIMHCTWDTSSPYCGSYTFGGGTSLVGCYAFESITESVMEMSDYFSAVYGPNYTTMDQDDDDDDDPTFPETEDDETSTEPTSTPTEPTDTVVTTTLDPGPTGEGGEDGEGEEEGEGDGGSKKNVSGGAIAGIVVGSVAIVSSLGSFIAWWAKRKRERAASDPYAIAQAAHERETANQPPPGPSYGQPPPPAGGTGTGYYEAKPPMAHEAPAYTTYDPKHQSVVSAAPTTSTAHPAPQVSEMPGSPTGYGHQHMSSGPTSPNTVEGMSATHTGPMPELYEIGPSR